MWWTTIECGGLWDLRMWEQGRKYWDCFFISFQNSTWKYYHFFPFPIIRKDKISWRKWFQDYFVVASANFWVKDVTSNCMSNISFCFVIAILCQQFTRGIHLKVLRQITNCLLWLKIFWRLKNFELLWFIYSYIIQSTQLFSSVVTQDVASFQEQSLFPLGSFSIAPLSIFKAGPTVLSLGICIADRPRERKCHAELGFLLSWSFNKDLSESLLVSLEFQLHLMLQRPELETGICKHLQTPLKTTFGYLAFCNF